ncbi:hypothetical protein vseg_008643 [Gypsophila vaccaria]
MGSAMADSWLKEYNEAAKLTDDANDMISEKTSTSGPGSESQRHFSTLRRKITILGTRLDSLESLLAKLPSKQSITEKELNRRKDMLSNLRSKAKQMANTLNMSNFGNRDMLLGSEIKPADAMTKIAGLDNQGIVGLQRQVMKEQDEGLERLEESVYSTKHIALAVNEELNLHTRLIETLDQHVEATGSRLQRVARSLAILNRRTKDSCTCGCLVSSGVGILIVILTILVLIKYL